MAKIMKKAQSGRTVNTQRTKGSDPLSSYSPNIKRGSGNLIPVGAKKNPVTGKPLSAPKAKAKNGTSFGMLSVKAGVDKNPKPTAADRIAGAKGLAKYGKMMKKGGKCKNGC